MTDRIALEYRPSDAERLPLNHHHQQNTAVRVAVPSHPTGALVTAHDLIDDGWTAADVDPAEGSEAYDQTSGLTPGDPDYLVDPELEATTVTTVSGEEIAGWALCSNSFLIDRAVRTPGHRRALIRVPPRYP